MKKFLKHFADLFTDNRITMSSAALSYYLTMTFFPVVICIYTLLGRSIEKTEFIIDILNNVLPIETVEYLTKFLDYVSENYNILMMLLAISVVLISASAGFRSIQNTIGRMQGRMRYSGYAYFVFSFICSIIFIFVIYFFIVLMFLSKSLIDVLNKYTPGIEIANSWLYLRFILLFGIAFVSLCIIYKMCQGKHDRYRVIPGAIVSTLLLVLVSYWFSKILSYAVKYPLVYGSLASIILLMFWLYCICLCIYLGATMNVTIRDMKLLKKEDDFCPEE